MTSFDLLDIENRFLKLRDRALAVKENCPYRFFGMSDDQVDNWLDKHFFPRELCWTEENINDLGLKLGRLVPEDYKIFLRVLGNLHGRLFGYDYDLRSPEDYVELSIKCLDSEAEQWGDVVGTPQFYEMIDDNIFLNTLGGFAVWHLHSEDLHHSQVKCWNENDSSASNTIDLEGDLIECLESRMSHFEWRIGQYSDSGILIMKSGRIPAKTALGNELMEISHHRFSVELNESQKSRIRAVFRVTSF